MPDDHEELLARIAQLPESDRHQLMVELGRRYGLPDAGVVSGTRAPSGPAPLDATPDYRIVFAGGARGSTGQGHGSYLLSGTAGGPIPLKRLSLDARVTEAEAQYDTLIAALQDLLARMGAAGVKPETFTLEVCTDSVLVISQVQGSWRTRDPRLEQRCRVARQLLTRFRGYRLVPWDPRETLKALGL